MSNYVLMIIRILLKYKGGECNMINNKELGQIISQRFNNNDSKEFILGFVSGLYVGLAIDAQQKTDITKYVNNVD